MIAVVPIDVNNAATGPLTSGEEPSEVREHDTALIDADCTPPSVRVCPDNIVFLYFAAVSVVIVGTDVFSLNTEASLDLFEDVVIWAYGFSSSVVGHGEILEFFG